MLIDLNIPPYRISILRWPDAGYTTWGANKAAKLKGYLADLPVGVRTLVVAGGAYSNLLWAVAAMGQQLGLKTVGLIRGDELADRPHTETPGLTKLRALGMSFHFLDRNTYRAVCSNGPQDALSTLLNGLEAPYFIPEGASSVLALAGVITVAKGWMAYLEAQDQLVVPIGTGTTMAGIAIAKYQTYGLEGGAPTIGFAPYKNHNYTSQLVSDLIRQYLANDVQPNDHQYLDPIISSIAQVSNVTNLGKYGKPSAVVRDTVSVYQEQIGYELNTIYTGFCLTALLQQLQAHTLAPNRHYVLVDTGGIGPSRVA